MPQPKLQLQSQYQRAEFKGSIPKWRDIPTAEKNLLIGLTASMFLSLKSPALTILACGLVIAYYCRCSKPQQDATVRKYFKLLNAHGQEVDFFSNNKEYKKIIEEVGGSSQALDNACIWQFN